MKGRRNLVVLALPLVAACGILSPNGGIRSDLDENRARWEEGRPTRYSVTVERLCFCTLEARGPVVVTVDGPEVTSRIYTDSGEPVPENLASLFPSIDGIFDVMVDALDRNAHEIRVTYDPATGVPFSVWIDYDENTADEEQGFNVTLPLVVDP